LPQQKKPKWRDDPRRAALARWAALYAALAGASAVALIGLYQLWWLALIGLLAGTAGVVLALLERSGRDRSLAGELLGMAGLSAAVPAAYYVSSGAFEVRIAGLWVLAALIFCGGVLHVRHVVGRLGLTPSVAFHAGAVLTAAAAGHLGLLPSFAFMALLPALLRAAGPMLRPNRPPPTIRRLGLQELGYGLLFVVLTVLCYRF
jgi:hypothetical protein